MDITILPGKLSGTIAAIPSKSQAHRLLICAAFADKPTTLLCDRTNRDITATAACLRSLGADIRFDAVGYHITPIQSIPHYAQLPCGESGSTLRFLLPIVGALGVEGHFIMEGRLGSRPLSPLWEEMERMGCKLTKPDANTLICTGKLKPGAYSMDGSVSSQFVTGLLFALSLIPGSSLTVTGKIESAPYIEMTKQAMALFRAPAYRSPGEIFVEGDWSNGAFWLAAKALGSPIAITNLCDTSPQGDKAAAQLLPALSENITISAADIPDLVPILSVVAGANKGAVFTNIRRLRLKESDRVESTISLLQSLGGHAEATEDTLTVYGTGLTGGTVHSFNDHRIAMAAAIASTVCPQSVTILGAQCTEKSYPDFWRDFQSLGGHYEQHLR